METQITAFEIGKVDLSTLEDNDYYFAIVDGNATGNYDKECIQFIKDKNYFRDFHRNIWNLNEVISIYLPTSPLVMDEERIEQIKFKSIFTSFLVSNNLEGFWENHCDNARRTELQIPIHTSLSTNTAKEVVHIEKWKPSDGDTKCQVCHQPNPLWTCHDNEFFNKVNGSPDGILCPKCFEEKANIIGVQTIFLVNDISVSGKDISEDEALLDKRLFIHYPKTYFSGAVEIDNISNEYRREGAKWALLKYNGLYPVSSDKTDWDEIQIGIESFIKLHREDKNLSGLIVEYLQAEPITTLSKKEIEDWDEVNEKYVSFCREQSSISCLTASYAHLLSWLKQNYTLPKQVEV